MAAVDYFLKIKGIEGESHDATHKGEIEITCFKIGERNPTHMTEGGGLGAGKVEMQEVHFTAPVGKHSPTLELRCATGEHIDEAVLTCRKAGKEQQEFLKTTWSTLFISSYERSGSAGDSIIPQEQFSMSFSKVVDAYRPQKSDGTLEGAVSFGWDVNACKKI